MAPDAAGTVAAEGFMAAVEAGRTGLAAVGRTAVVEDMAGAAVAAEANTKSATSLSLEKRGWPYQPLSLHRQPDEHICQRIVLIKRSYGCLRK